MEMNKRKNLLSILIFTLTFIVVVIIVLFISMIISISKHKNVIYYVIDKEDRVPSITYVLGEKRKLYYYKSYVKNSVPYKTLKYKDVHNTKSDLTSYINALRENYNYVSTTDIDFTRDEGDIQLCTNSIYEDEIIVLNISYSKDRYSITISKNKGYINPLKRTN